MANGRGYLGKISAIVSANTGDYVRKLDDSAKRTAAFARTIQSDLTKASREASRSIDAILTPLQRFERAIQNAASARLKFRGIDVAVRTIEDLRRSLAALDSDQEKEFAVRVSGLRNITELKNVLTDIREEDIDLAVNVGGVEGLRRLRNEVREVNGEQINIRTGDSPARLEALIQKFSRLSPDRIRQISIAVESRQLDAAILKERQLVSLAKEIAAPLSASVAQFDKLTQEVQAGFIPALSAAQNRVEAVRDRIEAGGQVGQRAFRRIADEVRQTTEAIDRLAEAQRLVQSIGTGRSLRDTSPRQFDALTRAAEQSRRSEQVSAQVAAQFGLGDRQQRVGNLAGQVSVLQARRESQEQDLIAAKKAKNSTLEAEIQRRLQLTIQYEARKTAELERQLGLQLNQIEAAERLDEAQRGSASSPFASFRDPQGRPLVERFREQGRVRSEEERRAEVAADQQRRREVATTFLPPVIDLPPDPRQASLERTQALADRLGPDLASSSSALSRLESSTVSLKNQIDQLPAPFRASLIPAIRQAEAELIRLVAADDALPEDIERAAQTLRGLTAGVTQAQKAATGFGGSFREFADNADIQGAAGRLQFLRQQLLRATGDTARAEAAADNLAAVFQRAASTPGGFRAISAELNQVEREAVEAAAAVLGVSPNRLAEQLKRAGDISRGAFGNTGLAVQQAIFAFDDFFSVTGDLSQRIRAAGNNISQLGFIIGGTAGLITGVALSAFSQVAVALINWANSGRTAEDQTKALNDALSRQKSLAEELAQAFSSLGDSIARRAFSGPAQEARAFREELDDIVGKLRELRDQRALGLDERVQAARADVSVAERELGRATTRDQAVAAQRRLDEARRRLAAEESRVRNRPDVTLGQATARAQAVFDQATARAALSAQANAAIGGPGAVAVARDAAVNAGNAIRDRVLAGLRGVNDPAQARQVLSDAQARASERGDTRLAGQLEELINSLDAPIRRAADDFAARLFRSASTAAQQIELAQDNIAKAIQSGVPGALSIRRSLDRAAEEIDAAQSAISSAQRDFAESGQTRADADVRDERLRDADRRLQRARRDREAAIAQARDADTQRIVDPQSTLEARRSRVEQNLQQSGVAEGFFARRLRQLEAQRSQLISDAEADPGNVFAQRRAERGVAAIDEEIRALEAATLALRTFADGLNRAAQVVQSDLDASRQDAASARRRDLGVSTPQSRREREARAADLLDQQDAARRAQRDIDIERGRLEEGIRVRDIGFGVNDPLARLAAINEQLQSGAIEGDQRNNLIAERERILAFIQPVIDAFDIVVQEITASAERLREVSLLAAEGRELSLTPAERSGEQLARQLEAVRLAFATEAERTTGLIDQAGQREAQQRVLADNIRQAAPLRVQFGEEVANAILQGPSRAALQVSDATTVEGNRELSRLLRGDDPARDVNVIELQRQTQALEELLRIARDQGIVIAQ